MQIGNINLLKDEKGNALVIFAFTFMVAAGIAGLAIDMGILYNTKSHLQKTASAAALSGAQELTNSSIAITDVVSKILKAHGEEESLKEIRIKPDNQDRLRVSLEKDVPTYFLKLFNIDSVKVDAEASAELAPMGSARGAVPLGIDESIPLEYMKEYKLKVDSGDSASGYFGILALSGPGAKLYEQDLTYGYDGEIKVGDIIDTQTGNIEGKTRDAVSYRISSCPYGDMDFDHRDCPRIMLVIVYEPYNMISNQMKQVKVKGFAYFYLKSPMNKNDSSITGYFIKRAGAGMGGANAADRGAYAIRLTE